MTSYPSVPYILPYVVFIALMLSAQLFPMLGVWEQIIRVTVMIPVLWFAIRSINKERFFPKPILSFRLRSWFSTLLIGVAIFVIWVAPDLLFPNYRQSILFQNPIMGFVHASLPEADRHSPSILALRTIRASVIVPIVEELFWRAWLMRWLIAPDFRKIPLGMYTAASFWAVSFLFAAEHGPYWEVGLVAGIIFNLWMISTKSLGDLIFTHAVANACLSAYVIATGKWEYWQ